MFSKGNYIHFILIYLKREHIYLNKRQHVDTDQVLKNHLLCWHTHRINNSALGRVVILWVLKEPGGCDCRDTAFQMCKVAHVHAQNGPTHPKSLSILLSTTRVTVHRSTGLEDRSDKHVFIHFIKRLHYINAGTATLWQQVKPSQMPEHKKSSLGQCGVRGTGLWVKNQSYHSYSINLKNW